MAIYDVNGNEIATGGGSGGSGSESTAKERLNGKVLIAIGDSYTVGMSSQLSALATKYGMVIDNRGYIGATISYRATDSARRIYNIVDTVVSDYITGKAISGTTYHSSDVGLVTFMGGANDANGVESWIGTGVHETDKTTIYGSLNHIFSVLQETFTNAKIVCITQPSFYSLVVSGLASDSAAQEIGFADLAEAQVLNDVQYSNYCQAMKEEAVRQSAWWYGLPLIDMFYEFPPVSNPTNRSTYWNNDKLHLTAAGYDYIKNAINKKIVELFGQEVSS